jgi:hypothetical protein
MTEDLVLYAWVARDESETRVARLEKAYTAIGTINLVAMSQDVLMSENLLEALREQANKDGQTVRLCKFVFTEEMMVIHPGRQVNGRG